MVSAPYHTLNALRGVAAIGVLGFHAETLMQVQLVPHGYLAVDLFFVLSGFVVGHAYEARLVTGLRLLTFAEMRLVRFYPLYLAGLALGLVREAALIATHNPAAYPPATLAAVAATALVFIPYPTARRDEQLFSSNIPSWSLLYELLVNLAYAAAAPWLGTRLLAVVTGIAGAVFAGALMAYGAGDIGARLPELPIGLVRTVFSFGLGLLIHRLRPAVPRVPPLLLLGVVALALAAPVPPGALYDAAFVFVVGPLVVLLGTACEPAPRLRPAFVYLGVISFPLYAVHAPLLGTVLCAALLLVCPLLDRWYDAPMRRRIARLRTPRLPADPAGAAAP